MTETARFALPLLEPGQAQKELFHNEALARIDALLHPAVEGAPGAVPPPEPADGSLWLTYDAPTGAWSGQPHRIAAWTGGGWRFAGPTEGMTVWDRSAGHVLRWTGSGWQQGLGPRGAAIASPSGGTIIDQEARDAVAAVIVALKSHGLIE